MHPQLSPPPTTGMSHRAPLCRYTTTTSSTTQSTCCSALSPSSYRSTHSSVYYIKEQYLELRKVYKGNELAACVQFFTAPLGVSEVISLKYWSKVWSTYSLYDPSYSNKESFGFFVDVSNGFCFLLPSLMFLYAMTYDVSAYLSARELGMIGMVKFYVEFHGTCVYFLSFFLNNRQQGFSNLEVGLFVGFSNGLWFVFPLLGVYACYCMIMTDTFAVLR
eukprot:GSChrysophyteH2.ASY1.ANO1.1586.1 assembled CDS